MRYRHTGNVHKDFHLATETTLKYLLDEYGRPFVEALFRRTAHDVYRDIYQNLVGGDFEPLLEHWRYYYEREDGEFEVERTADGVIFNVIDCPAIRHVAQRNGTIDPAFYLQFELLNQAFSEGSPFLISYESTGPRSYRFIVTRRP